MKKRKDIFYKLYFIGGGKHFHAQYNDWDESYTLYVYDLDNGFLEQYKKAVKNGLTSLEYKQVETCLYIAGLNPDLFESGKYNYLFNKALVKRLAKIGKR